MLNYSRDPNDLTTPSKTQKKVRFLIPSTHGPKYCWNNYQGLYMLGAVGSLEKAPN